MSDEPKKSIQSRFQRHVKILIWKSYLQRQRRWRLLLAETTFAAILYILAVFIAKPVFLTPLQAEPEAPLTSRDILASLNTNNIVGYAPNEHPYTEIMMRASELLKIYISGAKTERDLDNMLYLMANGSVEPISSPVTWIIWKPKVNNKWVFSIRSTERAKYETGNIQESSSCNSNPHLRSGFLAVQLAISQAIVDYASDNTSNYDLNLVSMPVSPLMEEHRVRSALSMILLCFVVSFIPSVLDTELLVMAETTNMFKRGLRIRNVSYCSMYTGWLFYAYLTTMPTCFLASVTLILIFRWIGLLFTMGIVLAYVTMLIMMALMMAMYHRTPWLACVWSALLTLLTTYLAELIVHHEYDQVHVILSIILHFVFPPLGLIHALNKFALLQIGHGTAITSEYTLLYLVLIWFLRTGAYFALLMLLQRTIGHDRAIGGQVSWKSIIFKKIEEKNKVRRIETPTGKERDKLQEVDEMTAKAVSFRNVSKSIMGVPILNNITMDIYRGEFTMLFSERVQERMLATVDDLVSGLTKPDKGSIYVLGHKLAPSRRNFMTELYMMGYCHRDTFLVSDLTVEEHFKLFLDICLWQESREFIDEYGHMRTKHLLTICDLLEVQHVKVSKIDTYYRAQLCWALAILLEPRVVIISNFSDQNPRYVSVIRDKIMTYKKYLTLIKISFTSLELEFADRIFVFDTKMLAFGGTPAYMFFKFGREYRIRITIRSEASDEERSSLITRAIASGATVRAHLGLLLILRLPANPTANVALLVKDLVHHDNNYGITSINISVPDSEEVSKRAISELRSEIYGTPTTAIDNQTCIMKDALKRYAEPITWQRKKTMLSIAQLRIMGWKYFSFHRQHKLYFIIMILAAFVTGIFIGLDLSAPSSRDEESNTLLLHGVTLTMEALTQETTLVLRSDNSSIARSMSHAYVLSEPGATLERTQHISCNALSDSESLTEYLVTRAIDSPQQYVYMYAYGMDILTLNETEGHVTINALYSPIHYDYAAAARSLAKVYSTILRHYTGQFDASIQVSDYPLTLDLSPMGLQLMPPLFIQFLLILVISHMTLIPSMEHGLIRHMQKHAMDFSPVRYWLSLYFFDLILFWMLVALMTGVMMLMLFLVAIDVKFDYSDLMVIPFILIIYGFACIPQAYLFSLGPRVALNCMTFIIVNLLFGETTIAAKLFYGEVREVVLSLMNISPQFNMAYAFVKIKQIFNYNSECFFFEAEKLCDTRMLHKCCEKCGVLQKCFVKKNYLNNESGVIRETIAMTIIGILFTIILLTLEYKLIKRLFKKMFLSKIMLVETPKIDVLTPGAMQEKVNVDNKVKEIKDRKNKTQNPFGAYLLAQNLTRTNMGMYAIHNVNLGVKGGQAMALSGLMRHGRLHLVEMLAGYKVPSQGQLWIMDRWNLESDPHMYARQVTLSCDRSPLPPWMTVYDGLEMLGLLRGVPKEHLRNELMDLIEALEFKDHTNTIINQIKLKKDRLRLHFAAAVIGAPPIVVLDECTAAQKYSVRRAIYFILHTLKKRGHAVVLSSSNVESHMPITNRLAILVDGTVYDVDTVDTLVDRYSNKGYTIVVHLKDDVDVAAMFRRHFNKFTINDTSDVLVNVQVLDDLNWSKIFQKMEELKKSNQQVYSYIITSIPMDYIYNSIINNEQGNKKIISGLRYKMFSRNFEKKIKPSQKTLQALTPFERKYEITKLKELPWSVIFHT